MRSRLNPIYRCMVIVTILCLFSPLFVSVHASDSVGIVVLVPLANLSTSQKGYEYVVNGLVDGLQVNGITIFDRDSLRSMMREVRLRLSGQLDSAGVQMLVKATGCRYFITGSVDVCLEQENPEVGVSLRVYDASLSRLVWLSNQYTTGEDMAGLFGIGRTNSLEAVAAEVVGKLIKEFSESFPANQNDGKNKTGLSFAVAEFDNATEFDNGGEVASNAAMLSLWRRGFPVLEPGELIRMRSQLGVDTDGLTDSMLARLNKNFEIDYVVTGSVAEFEPVRNAQTNMMPRVEMTVRVISTLSGTVVAATPVSITGDYTETLFGAGANHSLGKTAYKAVDGAIKDLIKNLQKTVSAVEVSGEVNAQK